MVEATTHDGEVDGVRMDLISGARMDGLTSMEKIRLILDSVRDGDIVVLEQGLTPDEESRLIEVTMTEISPDDFSGIEIETYPRPNSSSGGFISRLTGSKEANKLTVIGPANQIETIEKDEEFISTLVSRQ
jgi:hypothetical protein